MSTDYVMSPAEMAASAHKRAEAAELHALALAQEIEAMRAATPDKRLAEAKELISHLKVVVSHSIANLSPEFIRDLPGEALEGAAKLLPTSVGATQRDQELADVWAERARHVYAWRDKRKTPEWQARVEEYNAKSAAPPKTFKQRLMTIVKKALE